MATFTGVGKLLKDVTFSELKTSAKNIIGAINELKGGITGNINQEYNACYRVLGLGLVAFYPRSSTLQSVSISSVRVFTNSGWHNTTVSTITSGRTLFTILINDTSITDIEVGKCYLCQLTGVLS